MIYKISSRNNLEINFKLLLLKHNYDTKIGEMVFNKDVNHIEWSDEFISCDLLNNLLGNMVEWSYRT